MAGACTGYDKELLSSCLFHLCGVFLVDFFVLFCFVPCLVLCVCFFRGGGGGGQYLFGWGFRCGRGRGVSICLDEVFGCWGGLALEVQCCNRSSQISSEARSHWISSLYTGCSFEHLCTLASSPPPTLFPKKFLIKKTHYLCSSPYSACRCLSFLSGRTLPLGMICFIATKWWCTWQWLWAPLISAMLWLL